MLDTVTMMMLALERCSTALCGVEVMGELAETYGFVPTPGEPTTGNVRGRIAWDDAGEGYTLADKTGAAWVFHVLGGVSGVTRSVWAAQKIKKGHLAVIPNEWIIGDLPEEPNDEFLFNKDIHKAALVAGLWDGKGKLNFAKVFGPDPVEFESPTGSTPIPLYGSLRRWGIYDKAAPSLKLPFQVNSFEMPFSVKPEKALTHRDVMAFFRYQYEGTEFDLTKGMLAGPFGNPFRLEGGPKSGQVPRGISIQRTLYGIVNQCGPEETIGWFAHDTPTTAVYVPLFARGLGTVSPLYTDVKQSEFSHTAPWAFNFVSNFMQLNYEAMSSADVYPAIEAWQDTIDAERAEAANWDDETLAKWQLSVQERVVHGWWKLSEFLIMKYNDGKTNHPKVGASWAYPEWYATAVGFSNDVHPKWSEAADAPPASVPGYVSPVARLPQVWHSEGRYWSWEKPVVFAAQSLAAAASSSQGAMTLLALCCSMVFGITVGRSYERGVASTRGEEVREGSYKPLL